MSVKSTFLLSFPGHLQIILCITADQLRVTDRGEILKAINLLLEGISLIEKNTSLEFKLKELLNLKTSAVLRKGFNEDIFSLLSYILQQESICVLHAEDDSGSQHVKGEPTIMKLHQSTSSTL